MKRFFLALAAISSPVFAQSDWPARPVTLINPFAAASAVDVVTRLVAQRMTQDTGKSFLVENRTGANGLIGTLEVKKAPGDGYTLLVTTLSHNVNALLMADKKPYDPLADFTPVSLVAFLPMVMVTAADSPYNSLQDVIEAAKAKPGEVSYGSAGNGGSAHLAGALLATLTNTRMTHVPFRGNAPALTEVMAGRVSYMFYPMIGIAEQVQQKRLKALAARDNHVPFFVALPGTTIDWTLTDGSAIPIEERGGDEVTRMTGRLPDGSVATVEIAPKGTQAANYGFDVTPARLVTGFITERGVVPATPNALVTLYPEHREQP